MQRILILSIAAALLGAAAEQTHAGDPLPNRQSARFAQYRTWHANYAYSPYGQPTALVVPPTASTYSTMGWGVGQTEVRSLYHRYQRTYPGYGGDFGQFRRTPYWPSHTDQFGVYYVRGPWGHQ